MLPKALHLPLDPAVTAHAYAGLRLPQRRKASFTVDWDGTEDEHDIAIARRNKDIALRIGAHIDIHYKNVLWRVMPDVEGGIIRIFHPLLPKTWGYTVFLREFNSDPGLKCITRACGELLERFHLPRGRYNRDVWAEARVRYANTANGVFPLKYDRKTGRFKREIPTELAR